MSTQTTYHVGRCHLGHGVSEEGVLLAWGATDEHCHQQHKKKGWAGAGDELMSLISMMVLDHEGLMAWGLWTKWVDFHEDCLPWGFHSMRGFQEWVHSWKNGCGSWGLVFMRVGFHEGCLLWGLSNYHEGCGPWVLVFMRVVNMRVEYHEGWFSWGLLTIRVEYH